MTLDTDNIRFMRIFAGVPWKGGVIQQWGNRKRVFSRFRTLRIRHLRKWGQHYYIVLFSPLSPFHWPQDLWSWMTFKGHFTLYVHYDERPLTHYLLLIFCYITVRVKFGDNNSNGGRIIAIFRFSKWRSAAILDFDVFQKWHYGTLRVEHGHQQTEFGEDIWNSGWDMAIFLFPKWRPSAILDFVTGQKWRYCRLQTVRVHVYHRAKFGNNSWICGRVIAIFRFSKWRSAAILDFGVFQKWHHGTLRANHSHQHTKFGEDNWNSGWDIAIFLFPKWRPSAILDFVTGQKCVTAGCGLSMSTTVPNLVTIAQTAAELLRFSVFFFKMAAGRHLGFGPTDL